MSTPALLHHFPRYFYSGIAQRDWNSIPTPLIWSVSLCDVLKMFAQQWFSHARVTRARIPGLLHFLLSQPSQRNEKPGLFSTQNWRQNRAKNILHFHKNVGDSHKNVGVFWKNVGDFLKNVGRFFLKYSEILPTQPRHFVLSATKIEGKSPISLKLPSFHLLFLSQAQKIRQSFCPKIPHFSPRFPLFNQHPLNVC